MKKFITLLLSIICFLNPAVAADENSQEQKMKWWNDAKFGMFVHWGPYALYSGEYHGYPQNRGGAEWIMNRCKIPVREYRAMASTFNPIHFNADSMVLLAKNAGARYIVFTTKHHDGFAMFKSDASRFNIVDYTPFKRDIVDEVAQACKRHGIKFGIYYSQSQDWNNPGGNAARKLMREGWANPDSVEIDNYTAQHDGAWDAIQHSRDFNDYFYSVALPQMKELLDRYGDDLGAIFFDTPQRITDKQAGDMMKLVSEYPQIIVNDRLKRPNFPGDYKTPEGRVPKAEDIEGIYWETCMNIGNSWGYKKKETKWKSSKEIIRNLVTIAARGGNYLLNIGPDGLGDVPEQAVECLNETGKWLSVNGEAIYGTLRSGLAPGWGEVVRKDNDRNSSLYLCVFDWPENGKLRLDGNFKVKEAVMLADGEKLKFNSDKNGVTVSLPSVMPDKTVTVIRLDLKNKLPKQTLISNSEKVFRILDTE